MKEGLPRGVEVLLRLSLPSDLRESIAGDLLEDHRELVRQKDRARAFVAVWAEAIRIGWRFRLERTVHGRPLPPIADELRRPMTWDALRQDV
jgi:hypothetical protein